MAHRCWMSSPRNTRRLISPAWALDARAYKRDRARYHQPLRNHSRSCLDRMGRKTGRVGNHRGGSLPPLRESEGRSCRG
jgi:hypothetical protein